MANLNTIKTQIYDCKDKISQDKEYKEVLTGKIQSLSNKFTSNVELLEEYKSDLVNDIDQSIKIKNGNKSNSRRKISIDEIDMVKKNITNLALDIEMEHAKKDDIIKKIN